MIRTKNFKPFCDKLECQHCGEEGVQQWALDKLQLIRDDYGKPMYLTSAYRCDQHPNERVKSKPGTHNKGVAFDVFASDGIAKGKLLELALKHGAKGIGIANNFIHIDFDLEREHLTVWSY